MKLKDLIIKELNSGQEVSVKSLSDKFNFSRQMIHRVFVDLLAQNQVIKIGVSPKVYYKLSETLEQNLQENSIHYSKYSEFLQKHFLWITPLGEKKEGLDAITARSLNQNLPIEKTIEEYIVTRKKYLNFFNPNQVIDGTQKLRNTKGFEKNNLEKLYYLDFYAIESFGKTRLGTLMHFAKQGQNKKLMAQIVEEIKPRIDAFIKNEKPDAILLVPPTIKRETQLINYLRNNLHLNKYEIQVKKVSGEIVIPQKALSKLPERIANAQMSFVVTEKLKFNKILLIDDAVGSGATMNEIAGKLLSKGTAKTVIGLAITGSYKGFEVISEL